VVSFGCWDLWCSTKFLYRYALDDSALDRRRLRELFADRGDLVVVAMARGRKHPIIHLGVFVSVLPHQVGRVLSTWWILLARWVLAYATYLVGRYWLRGCTSMEY